MSLRSSQTSACERLGIAIDNRNVVAVRGILDEACSEVAKQLPLSLLTRAVKAGRENEPSIMVQLLLECAKPPVPTGIFAEASLIAAAVDNFDYIEAIPLLHAAGFTIEHGTDSQRAWVTNRVAVGMGKGWWPYPEFASPEVLFSIPEVKVIAYDLFDCKTGPGVQFGLTVEHLERMATLNNPGAEILAEHFSRALANVSRNPRQAGWLGNNPDSIPALTHMIQTGWLEAERVINSLAETEAGDTIKRLLAEAERYALDRQTPKSGGAVRSPARL